MSNYGFITTGLPVFSRVVESADPSDLAARVNAALDELALITVEVEPDLEVPLVVSDIQLAGAGDGHTFVVSITASPAAGGGPAGLAPGAVRVSCYLASEAEAVALARTVAIAAITDPPVTIMDEFLAGASKGTRFMGMFLTAADAAALDLLIAGVRYTYAASATAAAVAVAIATQSVPVIVPGTYVLTDPEGLFVATAPGHLTYVGTKAFQANVRVRMSLVGAAAGPNVARGGILTGSALTSFGQSQTITIDNTLYSEVSAELNNMSFGPGLPTGTKVGVGLANDTNTDDFSVLAVELIIQPIR